MTLVTLQPQSYILNQQWPNKDGLTWPTVAVPLKKKLVTQVKYDSCAEALSHDMTGMLISSVHPFGQLYNAAGS